MLSFDSMNKFMLICAFIHLLQIITLIISAIGIEICPYSYRTYDSCATYIVYFFLWLLIVPFLGYSMYDIIINLNNQTQIFALLSITSNIFNMIYLTFITFFDIGHRIYETIDYSYCGTKNEDYQSM